MRKSILILSTITILMALSACATTSQKRKELELYNDANLYFTKGKYETSRNHYQNLLDKYPDSPFRVRALLGVADSYYLGKEYFLAEPMYERFIELYPLDALTPHALFYKGMSYHQDIKKVPRDQTYTKNTMDTFKEFLFKYPNHPAGEFTRQKIAALDDLLAQKEFYILAFYYKINAFGSCISLVDDFVAVHPDTRYVPEALLIKGKSYKEEEAFEKARYVFERIVEEYGGTPAGKDAKTEIKALKKRKKG